MTPAFALLEVFGQDVPVCSPVQQPLCLDIVEAPRQGNRNTGDGSLVSSGDFVNFRCFTKFRVVTWRERGRRGFPQASGKCKLCIGDQSMQMAKHNAQSTQSVSNMLKPHVCSVTSPFRFCGMLRVLAVLQRLSKTLPSLWTMNIYESCYQLCQVEVNIG